MKKIYIIVLILLGGVGAFAQYPEPSCASNLSPANGSTGIKVRNQVLTFSRIITPYIPVYFRQAFIYEGITNIPGIGNANYTSTISALDTSVAISSGTLKPNTTYTWSITTCGSSCVPGCNVTYFTTAPLTCVANIAPTNASVNQSIRPTFTWNTNNGADSYDLYIGTSPSNATLLTNVSTNSYTVPNNNNLLENTTYYWYVVPKNSAVALGATGCTNNITSFTTGQFSCTQNVLPANASIDQSTIPTFAWNSNAGATSYDVYLGTSSVPTNLVANVTQPTYTIPVNANLLNSTTYYWYVVPKNGTVVATGCESNITSFTTAPLNCVNGTSPANGQTLLSSQINLTWNATGASFYDVFVGTTNPPTTLVANVATNSYTFSNYAQNSTYYWYVVPRNGNLTPTGCASNVRNFNTGSCAQNSLPPNGSKLLPIGSNRLEWFPFSGATNYDVYVNGSLITNVTTSFYQFGHSDGGFTWYVIPKNSAGVAIGCPSSPFTFSTITLNSPFGCTGLYSPLNGQTNVSLMPIFSWGYPALGAYAYTGNTTLHLGTSINGPFTVFNVSSSPPGYSLNTLLLPNTTYYWYVSFITTTGSGDCSSNISRFTTAPNACVANISPANNATDISINTSLTWQASPIPTAIYDLYLGTTNPPNYLTTSTTNSFSFPTSPTYFLPNTTYYWYVAPRLSQTSVATGCATNVTSFTTSVLSCVANILPLNNSNGNVIKPTLTWQSNGAATSYDIYFGTNNNPTTLLANVNTNSYTIPNNNSLLLNTTYYWYVVPKNGTIAATGCATNVTSFTTTATINCVNNITPSNAATNVLSPLLTWQASPSATSYDIYYGTSIASTSLLANVSTTSYSVTTPNLFSPSTTYYWYIVPRNGNAVATGCASNITSFTTAPLSCVSNILPANNTTVSDMNYIVLAWNANSTATSYDIYIGTTNNPTTYVGNLNSTIFILYPNAYSLLPNSTYYWYVVPKNGSAAATGCLSNVTSFNTPPLTCTQVLTPQNFSTGNSLTPLIRWYANSSNNSVTAATSFDLYFGTTNPPTTFITNTTNTQYQIPNQLLFNTTYYWYVVPKFGNLVATGCTVNSFKTLTIPCSANSSPSNGSTAISVTPTFSWNPSNLATSYDLYLGTTSTTATFITNSTNNFYTIPSNLALLPSTTYYWYVVPKNGSFAPTGCISNMTSFTTGLPPTPSCVSNYLPTNAATNVSETTTLTWFTNTYPAAPDSYSIYLGTTNPPTTLLANIPYQNSAINNFTIPNNLALNPATTYYWYIAPKLGNVTASNCASTVTSFTTIPSNCIPPYTGACNSNINIADFKLMGEGTSNINIAGTNCSTGSYTDLSASTNVTLATGKAYVGGLRPTTYAVPLLVSIWIDYNNNGGFELNENVLNTYSLNTTLLQNGFSSPFSIYIPTIASLGVHKMRVRQVFGPISNIQACAVYNYGETKDFTVTIVANGSIPIVSTETNCNLLAGTTINSGSNNNNIFVPILDISGNIVAMLNANGNDLNQIQSSIYRNTGAIRQTGGGNYYLDRNITITPSAQPVSGNVSVRLFYSAAELAAFQSVVSTASTSTLNVTKTSQGCSSSFTGVDTFLPQTGNGTLGSDYYIDVSTPSFSSFFIKSGLGVLPLSVEYFKGSKQQASNILDWKLTCDAGTSLTVTLERSGDGRTFNGLQTQTITDVMCANAFTYKDAAPLAGTNYYRLQMKTAIGEIKYSVIVVLLNKEKGFELISIVPNPVKSIGLLTVTSARAGKINIIVSDVTGKKISEQTAKVIAGSNNINMNFEKIAAGTYLITAVNDDGEIKATKFVKY